MTGYRPPNGAFSVMAVAWLVSLFGLVVCKWG